MSEGLALHELVFDDKGQAVDYILTEVNPAFEKITGLKFEDEKGRKATERYEVEKAPFIDIYAQVEATGKPITFESYFSPMDKYFDISAFSPGKGKFVTIFRDITQQKQSDELLRKSEEKFRNLVFDMEVGVLLNNPKSEIILANPKAMELLGLTEDQITGKTPFDTDWRPIHEDGSPFPGETHPAAVVIATRKAVKNVVMGIYQPLREEHAWFLINAQPQLDDNGELLQVVTTFVEITELRNAQQELRESELRLKYHFENSPLGVVEWDHDFVVTQWSVEAERIFEYAKEETIGKPIGDLNLIYEEDIPIANRTMERLTSGEEDTVINSNRNVTKSGSIITTAWYNSILFDKKGAMKSVMSLVQDVSAQKHAEKALVESEERVRHKLQSILSPEGSIADLELKDIIDAPSLQSLMENFYELTQVPMAIIDTSGIVQVGVGWQDVCTKFHRVHPSACQNCIESDIQLTQGIKEGDFKLYKCKNNMWDIATPVIIGGEHKGNLFMGQFFLEDEPINEEFFRQQAEKYNFDEQEYLDAIHRVPRITYQKLEHAKAFFHKFSETISKLSYGNIKLARSISLQQQIEDSLRESEYLFRESQRAAFIGSYKTNFKTGQWESSEVMDQIFGIDNTYVKSVAGWLDIIHPDDRDMMNQYLYEEVVGKRLPFNKEYRILRKNDGEMRWIHGMGKVGFDENNNLISLVGTIQDIHDRKLKEETLRKLNKTLAALSKSSQIMSQSIDETEYLKKVCDIIVEDTDFAMVWIGFAEKDDAKTIRPVASAGLNVDYLNSVKVSWGDNEFGRGPTGVAVRTGKMAMCNNMFTDPDFEPWRDQALKRGYASSIVFPLLSGDKTFGAITIYVKEPDAFLKDEIKLLSKLANDLAHGITTIRLRNAHELAEEKLRKSHESLEVQVKERTAELVEINRTLSITEEKYRTVADFTYNMETWIDTNGNYIYVSPSCQKVTGYSSVEFLIDPKLMIKMTHPDDKKRVQEHFEEKIKGTLHNCNLDFRIITKEGKERWIGHSCKSVFNSNGDWIGQRGSNRNINKQKNAELVLIESEKHLRALTQRVDEVAEEERIRISREIHDEIGHLLTALKYDTEGLINHTNLSAEEVKTELSGMISMIEALIDSVRKIATELRPGILDHMGLVAALEWKIKQFRLKNKICCEYHIEEMDVQFTKNETTFIYRILQEIFTNVTRHSKATRMWISINKVENLFIMKISDNGVGFDVHSSLQKGSLGLLGMVERAKSIGGEVQIESEFGKGTTTTFILKK